MINKLKEEERDSWYKRMGNRKSKQPEDEPMVGLMEWVELLMYYK